ncbi:hypothetical protein HPP92_007470 [Vanilla planifolia]|uniref:Uncharacterized protein n=1 Tax=Vanilla planifolia TaxID=51239 RepID=A0A835RRF4_VANPL|nr:hypothetical protein HPP92_007470 [Vanilla planifolia]
MRRKGKWVFCLRGQDLPSDGRRRRTTARRETEREKRREGWDERVKKGKESHGSGGEGDEIGRKEEGSLSRRERRCEESDRWWGN